MFLNIYADILLNVLGYNFYVMLQHIEPFHKL